MDSFTALMRADEVKTFPTLEMPAPKTRSHPGRGQKSDENKLVFPGLLKTKKSIISGTRIRKGDESSVLMGFNSINLKFDVTSDNGQAYQSQKPNSYREGSKRTIEPSANNMLLVTPSNQPSTPPPPPSILGKSSQAHENQSLDELRNYIVMMDKYSLHNFMIYDGKTLKETPEFQSFKRLYQHKWGPITSIIQQLETFLANYHVKLAIINGPRVFELSKLNLPSMRREDMYSCLSNLAQLSIYFEGEGGTSKTDNLKAIVRIQSHFRACIARRRVNELKILIRCTIRIQSFARLLIQRSTLRKRMQRYLVELESGWSANRLRLSQWWARASIIEDRSESAAARTIVFLPSISLAEYLRLNFENFSALQNTLVSALYQLADPSVTLIYVCPKHLSSNEIMYHEKLLSLMGISLLPKRLYFVTPELVEKLPSHLPLSLLLLCSSVALNKIKQIVKRNKSMAMIIPGSVSWIEKKLSHALSIPVLSADPSVSESLSSRSFSKKVFEESEVNVPIGAHDIFNIDDLLVALSRLMASNVLTKRWIIKLNYDYNCDSCVLLDADKMSVVNLLRKEHNEMTDAGGWFSRQVQLAVRKRLLSYLTSELSNKVKICRRDIYSDWDFYLRMMKQYGAVVEAEPIETIGFVNGLCFIDPSGEVQSCSGVELYLDHNFQPQAYHCPQMMTPTLALEGATRAVAQTLFRKYGLIGYVTVSFQSYWDALDNIPRLWGVGLKFGMSDVFGAIGTVAVVSAHSQFQLQQSQKSKPSKSQPLNADKPPPTDKPQLPFSLVTTLPDDRCMTYVPFAVHEPLRTFTDESFFKLCRMRGIAFDMNNRSGTLFFVIDSVVGGAVSVLCVGTTRKKATAQVINALTFVAQQFGKDLSSEHRRCDNLTTILINMKKILKFDKNVQ